ncbi:MAG TPA: gamma-glutamylcyclotransferase family protein [Candidatus Nanopelagicales bacterium]|nr:gamma-glutamylcyclotransferase family protein [Candidatus Nanopelagicales bacterium]
MSTDPNAIAPGDILLFVYDSLLSGEPEHDLLARARPLGSARTGTGWHLVDLGQMGGLLPGGLGDVVGELYAVDRPTLASTDLRRGHPLAHHRETIKLADGREAEAYLLHDDQARGRRRIRGGDWRARFAPARSGERLHDGGPMVGWARDRFRR